MANTITVAKALARGQLLAVNISSHNTRPIMRFSGPPNSDGITNSPNDGTKTKIMPAPIPRQDNGTVTIQNARHGVQPKS